ncbi:hypothetical protein JCM10207_003894 [Rhodosporidiobolus poonsookiae]
MELDAPKLKIQIDCAYNLVVTVDFHADLTKPETVDIPLDLPLHGDWSIKGSGTKGESALRVYYGNMAVGRLGRQASLRYSLFWFKDGVTQCFDTGTWPKGPLPDRSESGGAYTFHDLEALPLEETAAASNGKYDPSTHRAYRLSFSIDSHSPFASCQADEKLQLATRLSKLSLEHVPHTFRLVFSKPDKTEAELWASGKLLSSKLPYFKDLLASDFEEAIVRRSKRARKSGAQPVDVADDQKSFDDSDDETDAVLFAVTPPKPSDATESADVSFHEIRIKLTAYSTYHALLVYLQTGMIRFAPLRSAASPSNPSSPSTRRDWLTEAACKTPSLPLPVSPKSLYRLIDLLRLPESDPLHDLCLRAFADSLTHHGAAHELFSDACVCLDKLRKAALGYVVENYSEVIATPSWKEMIGRVERDEVPGSSTVLVELMRAMGDALAKKG